MNLECSVKREAVFGLACTDEREQRTVYAAMGRAKRPQFVEYPNGMRVTVMQSKTFLDTYTGVVVDYDIVHGTVSPRVNEPGSMAGLRLPSLAATGTRTRRPTNSVGGRREVGRHPKIVQIDGRRQVH